MQAQTLSFSIQNNSTRLQTSVNAFAFTGVILDVVGAFLALLSLTLVQTNTDRIDRLQDALSRYTLEELRKIGAEIVRRLRASQASGSLSLLEYDILGEVAMHINKFEREVGHPKLTTLDVDLPRRGLIQPERFLLEIDSAGGKIITFSIVGDAAGTATLSGILCFLISVACLANATQPPSVWIPAIIACSCIVILPVSNRILASCHLSALVRFYPCPGFLMIGAHRSPKCF